MSDTTASVRDTAEKTADSVNDAANDVKDAAVDAAKDVAAAAKDVVADTDKAATKAVSAVRTSTAKKAEADAEKAPKPVRPVPVIEAELAATRARLAGRIDDLAEYVTPRNVVDRQVAKVKGVFVDEFGGIKPDRVLIAAGVVVAFVVVVGLSRRKRSE